MTFQEGINHYIEWRRTHGVKSQKAAEMLRQFCKQIERGIDCDAVTTEQVCRFLAGNGVLTGTRSVKYSALKGFYRYAIARGYAKSSPLPPADEEPGVPPPAPPYVYSKDELVQLFKAAQEYPKYTRKLDRHTFRTLLFLLYGAGLRVSEAQHLTLADVNLNDSVLTVRNTKFYKSRLVPISCELNDLLKTYAQVRKERPLPQGLDSTFLAYRDGTALVYRTVTERFVKVLDAAGICATDDERQNPCLHSLRHTFSVNRLTAWYREGADVQRLLPVLSTYLGHANLNSTQTYLTMTPELLHEASGLFNQYFNGENQ